MSTQRINTVINKDNHRVTISVQAEGETMQGALEKIRPSVEKYRELLTADIKKEFEKSTADIDGYEEFYADGGKKYIILEVEK